MKELKLVSIILIVLGLLLTFVGLIFEIMRWPDLFKGLISGPIFVLIGLVSVIINKLKN